MTGPSTRAEATGTIGNVLAIDAGAWLSAIVENSDDAILSKTLDGIIMTWNDGASRLFGYSAEEAIGKPVTIIIPDDRLHEEDEILRRLRAGERIEHFETVRRRKNGELIDISLTVSPVRNYAGQILGASKIARDITDQKRAQAQKALMFKEMRHRIKNLFALTIGLVSLSARNAKTVQDLAGDLSSRLMSLARAQELTLPGVDDEQSGEGETTLLALLETILAPHQEAEGRRIAILGSDIPLGGSLLTSLALVFHELTTNAVKYGALSTLDGRLSVGVTCQGEEVVVTWIERGAPLSTPRSDHAGFGTALENAALRGIQGMIDRSWTADGLDVMLRFPLPRLQGS